MSELGYYGIFCLTTAIAALLELFLPVLQELKSEKPELLVCQYYKLTVVTFGVLSFAIAPVILLSCLVPSMGIRFRESLKRSLLVQ